MQCEILSAMPTRSQLAATPGLLLCVPPEPPTALWRGLPGGTALRRRLEQQRALSPGATRCALDLPNAAQTHVTLQLVSGEGPAFERLAALREAVKDQLPFAGAGLCVVLAGYGPRQAARVAEAAVAAASAAAARLPSRKRKPEPAPALECVRLHGLPRRVSLARALAEGEGNTLARQLTALPPNELAPGQYRKRLEELASSVGWTLDFHDEARLQRLRAGAFLAVAQGSAERDAGIAHLTYLPRRGAEGRRPLALVGKGICFDTGGVNLKPAKYMLGMHEDMAGSAVALGTLLALTRLRVPFRVDAWLALAQNHVGPAAYKPNDVVQALNGRTIEIVHTDAEGRMVLADTLTLASRARPAPGLMIDFATLTGACVHALGKAYSGVFTNRDAWLGALIEAGRTSGERVWPFPLDADYDEALKSDVADTRQCAPDGEADHIIAARFLQSFVEGDVPWVHVDLSSASHPGGLAHVPTPTTGFGVRFALALLERLGWLSAGRG